MTASGQLSLLELPQVGAHRKTDPVSSADGARKVDANGQRQRILACLATKTHGMTRTEIAAETGIPKDEVSSRLSQLRNEERVDSFGFRMDDRGHRIMLWHYRTQPVRDHGTNSGLL